VVAFGDGEHVSKYVVGDHQPPLVFAEGDLVEGSDLVDVNCKSLVSWFVISRELCFTTSCKAKHQKWLALQSKVCKTCLLAL
jgi:hypothetical protein